MAADSGKTSLYNSLRDIKWVQKKFDTVVADVEEAKVVVDDVVSGWLDYFRLFMSTIPVYIYFTVYSRAAKEGVTTCLL